MNPRFASTLNWILIIAIVLSNIVIKPSGGFVFHLIVGGLAAIPLAFARSRPRVVSGIVVAISLVLALMSYPEYKAAEERYREGLKAVYKELLQTPIQQQETK